MINDKYHHTATMKQTSEHLLAIASKRRWYGSKEERRAVFFIWFDRDQSMLNWKFSTFCVRVHASRRGQGWWRINSRIHAILCFYGSALLTSERSPSGRLFFPFLFFVCWGEGGGASFKREGGPQNLLSIHYIMQKNPNSLAQYKRLNIHWLETLIIVHDHVY